MCFIFYAFFYQCFFPDPWSESVNETSIQNSRIKINETIIRCFRTIWTPRYNYSNYFIRKIAVLEWNVHAAFSFCRECKDRVIFTVMRDRHALYIYGFQTSSRLWTAILTEVRIARGFPRGKWWKQFFILSFIQAWWEMFVFWECVAKGLKKYFFSQMECFFLLRLIV